MLNRLRYGARIWYLACRIWLCCTGAGVASLLAAAQLLPTWELSRLSVRSGVVLSRGGLLQPAAVAVALHSVAAIRVDLSQVFGEAYSEYVAYVGVIGLGLAAFGLLRGWRRWAGTRFSASPGATGLCWGWGF
jgi:hypothetical protein